MTYVVHLSQLLIVLAAAYAVWAAHDYGKRVVKQRADDTEVKRKDLALIEETANTIATKALANMAKEMRALAADLSGRLDKLEDKPKPTLHPHGASGQAWRGNKV